MGLQHAQHGRIWPRPCAKGSTRGLGFPRVGSSCPRLGPSCPKVGPSCLGSYKGWTRGDSHWDKPILVGFPQSRDWSSPAGTGHSSLFFSWHQLIHLLLLAGNRAQLRTAGDKIGAASANTSSLSEEAEGSFMAILIAAWINTSDNLRWTCSR